MEHCPHDMNAMSHSSSARMPTFWCRCSSDARLQLQAIHTMDTYQWFVTILDALLSIFIALSVTVAIDPALFSARYAYMNVSSL